MMKPAMLLLLLSTLTACAPRGCTPGPSSPSSAPDAGPALDAGACNPNVDPQACGCCITSGPVEVRQCPPGVPIPSASVITLPVCGGG